jgi:hypothetical protein
MAWLSTPSKRMEFTSVGNMMQAQPIELVKIKGTMKLPHGKGTPNPEEGISIMLEYDTVTIKAISNAISQTPYTTKDMGSE